MTAFAENIATIPEFPTCKDYPHACSVGLLLHLHLILQRAQFAPALVLVYFGGIGILVALQPEAEPVNITLLGSNSLNGRLQDVLPVWKINQTNGLALLPE